MIYRARHRSARLADLKTTPGRDIRSYLPTLAGQAKTHLRGLLQRRDFGLPPRGYDALIDARRHGPQHPATVLDVGANVGQSTAALLRAFPKAHVLCFEPVRETFAALQHNVGLHPRVTAYNIGMSSEPREAEFTAVGPSVLASIATGDHGGEKVHLDALDAFCAAHDIDQVDYLKIDTEGHDLQVLKGAAGLLSRYAVAAVQVEAGMHPENTTHVPLETLKAFLEQRGYRCLGIYDQTREWTTDDVFLRRVNAVFVPGPPVAISPQTSVDAGAV